MIFKFLSIQAIINFRWGITKDYVLRKQMLPYIGFFLSYLVYVIWIFDMDQNFDKETDEEKVQHIGSIILSKLWMCVLLIYSAYFLWAEVKQ